MARAGGRTVCNGDAGRNDLVKRGNALRLEVDAVSSLLNV